MLLTPQLESFPPKPEALCTWESANSVTRLLTLKNISWITKLLTIWTGKISLTPPNFFFFFFSHLPYNAIYLHLLFLDDWKKEKEKEASTPCSNVVSHANY